MSPAAYYTGEVWVRGGLAPRELRTPQGVALYAGLQPAMRLARLTGGPMLTEAIESGRVTHVVEVAAGLSARGTRFAARYGDRITYVETDLPAMAARKRAHLTGLGTLSPHHRVEAATPSPRFRRMRASPSSPRAS